MLIHAPIPRLSVLVRSRYLFDMVAQDKPLMKGEIVALSSYPDQAPTATVLLEDGAMFHYLPMQAFCTRENVLEPKPADVAFHNCPGPDVVVTELPVPKQVTLFTRKRDVFVEGTYVTTMDWWRRNNQLHLIVCNDGILRLWPSHKVLFKPHALTLPSYKKLHEEFFV